MLCGVSFSFPLDYSPHLPKEEKVKQPADYPKAFSALGKDLVMAEVDRARGESFSDFSDPQSRSLRIG